MVDQQPFPRPQGRLDAQTGQRYVTHSDGAPPLPPPGGYRGAARPRGAALVGGPPVAGAPIALAPARVKPSLFAWIAFSAAAAFALTLVVMLVFGAADVVYSAAVIALQLLVVTALVAALFSPRGRTLGAWGLAIALLLNVGTVGALAAMRTTAHGLEAQQKTEQQRHQEAFPGVAGEDASATLARPSLEEVRTLWDQISSEIRSELTDRFGYTWTPAPAEDIRPERNGYGGESMLVRYTSTTWSTNEALDDYDTKLAVLDTIDDVLARHDWWELYAFNDPASGMDPDLLEKFYGSDDPRTQVTWEWYTEDPSGAIAFYASIVDLSNDPDGEWTADRQVQHEKTGEPIEGLRISFYAERLLKDSDREEFERRMAEY